MPFIAAVSIIDFPYKIDQQEVKQNVRELYVDSIPGIDRLLPAFDNTEIRQRNFCQPLSYYSQPSSFEQRNNIYISCTLDYSIQAIESCIKQVGVLKQDITDIIFVSSTGLSTPSMDALIINKMRLNPHIQRTPVFGLGCAGGVSGMAKACATAKANPDAIVLLIAVELCSLTFMRHDFSKSNFIATSLFSDGVAACIVKGDNHAFASSKRAIFKASGSKLYYDSVDVMGWEFLDTGFKVLFSQDIPTIIEKNVRQDIDAFLSKNSLKLSDIKNFIFHPGGKKVLTAYKEAIKAEGDFLKNTREVMNSYGNMSSCTVLYVLEKFMRDGLENGYGLMMALGPGFSSEMVLLNTRN